MDTADAREGPPAADGQADRLAWVFRHSLRDRTIHPALPVLQRLRDAPGVLARPVADAPARPADDGRLHISDEALRRHLGRLPAVPAVVAELSAMVSRDTVRADEIARRIERDQSLAAITLRMANSPFYGQSGRIASIDDAIRVLGLDSLSMLLTTAALSAHLGHGQARLRGFWIHSVVTATLSRAIATRLGRLDPDQAFLGGLLHDLGQLALTHLFPDEFAAALACSRAGDLTMIAAERRVLDRDHAAIGEWIATQWRFPAEVGRAISGHHEPQSGGRGPSLSDVVHVADSLAHAMDLSGDDNECLPDFDRGAWERLDLGETDFITLLRDAEPQIARFIELMPS